ncbi:MAG: S53 family peptidase, partial [Herminiimonas sp.]|nr:S53 family peptidase [Herminiimonas sp.]
DATASAQSAPRRQIVPAEFDGMSTRGLTMPAMKAVRRGAPRASVAAQDGTVATPMAAGSFVATYSPAQIRAAYGLPSLPAAGTTLTAAQAASLGAGQTIYIVDAQHDPSAAAELAAFNQKFGLPACTLKTIAPTAVLPLAAASTTGCELAIVYNTSAGGMTATAPAYNAGWAMEIALDVQWAHATAPLARIVLIESVDATLNSLLGGVKLANAMGPGVVSMSFGAAEGSWTTSVDAAFAAPNMSYLAATGDSGAAVEWPSVSSNVLAVGGTSLNYSGTGTRSETAWSGTGGGTSQYVAAPAYQSSTVPGLVVSTKRMVADVAFNADPSTGQYVAVLSPGGTVPSWLSVGGTSLSTPQWAGVLAVANAQRALATKAALGLPHAALYNQIATVPGTYASSFLDITAGSDGTCPTCTAKSGYDSLAGLGTPNVSALINALTGTATVSAPVVTSAAIAGKVGTALSFTASVQSANPVIYALTNAPSGMIISSVGAVTWPTPVAGMYSVVVNAKDSKTGLTGQGTYTVSITAATPVPTAPVVTPATVTGKPGVALTFQTSVSAPNAVTYTLTGAPSGMSIGGTGIVSWAAPVLGTFSVTVVAKDTKTGLSGQGAYTVGITSAGPTVTAAAITGVAGKSLSSGIVIADPGATSLSISISGVPMGMTFSVSGQTLTASWASPVAGTYSMKVTVLDNLNRSATATIPITIAK